MCTVWLSSDTVMCVALLCGGLADDSVFYVFECFNFFAHLVSQHVDCCLIKRFAFLCFDYFFIGILNCYHYSSISSVSLAFL